VTFAVLELWLCRLTLGRKLVSFYHLLLLIVKYSSLLVKVCPGLPQSIQYWRVIWYGPQKSMPASWRHRSTSCSHPATYVTMSSLLVTRDFFSCIQAHQRASSRCKGSQCVSHRFRNSVVFLCKKSPTFGALTIPSQ